MTSSATPPQDAPLAACEQALARGDVDEAGRVWLEVLPHVEASLPELGDADAEALLARADAISRGFSGDLRRLEVAEVWLVERGRRLGPDDPSTLAMASDVAQLLGAGGTAPMVAPTTGSAPLTSSNFYHLVVFN